jgi:hypothetical protein
VQAWDITAPQGTPIFPIEDGVVEYAGCNNRGGYGCWTYIRHDSGSKTIMGHMVNGSITVKAGQRVTQWDVVGQVGWTGMTSFGPHVHLEIHRPEGGRYNISDFWDINQMHYQKLGNAQGEEIITEIGVAGSVTTAQQPTTVATITRLDAIRAALHTAGPDTVSLAVVALFGLLCLTWWLGGLYERVAVVALATSSLVVGVAIWLTMPLTAPVQAGQQSALTGSAAWEWAYPAIQQQEGWSCTNDGAYTMGGVTQATFNRWRAKLGQPTGDVCRLLTRAEAKQIYHQLYWLPAGGDKLPAAVALTVVDHYINTGRYKFLLDQCGPDVACISRVRAVDYRSMRNFNIYGNAYLNRVQRIANYIQKGNQP